MGKLQDAFEKGIDDAFAEPIKVRMTERELADIQKAAAANTQQRYDTIENERKELERQALLTAEEARIEQLSKKTIDLKILCPFCLVPYTALMEDSLYGYASGGCDTCGPDTEIEGSIDIYCSNCKKLVYKKEY